MSMLNIKSEAELRLDLIRICRMMSLKNYVAATDGNVTIRMGDRILATPSGVNKGFLEADQLLVTDLDGQLVSGVGRPTTEIRIHLLVYQMRPDVQAVVHAHAPLATAFSIADIPLPADLLPEVIMTLGAIPTTDYATPASDEGPEVIRPWVPSCDAMILKRHGTLTLGRDVYEAYCRLEKVEHLAAVALATHSLGRSPRLSKTQVRRLAQIGVESGYISPAAAQLACAGVKKSAGKPKNG
ncbi:MAG: class II aldolase/adducin family protein [Deltaproteobacteria bacterium]|nr:class II aldolase/adducin family protein [Deltaproteobacteria bacterium]